jgi:hypothetical protein
MGEIKTEEIPPHSKLFTNYTILNLDPENKLVTLNVFTTDMRK